MKRKKLLWTQKAIESLRYYCQRIKENSPKYAELVRKEIIKTAAQLPDFPEKYQLDEYYDFNNGNIRRFFRWSYRVVYEVTDDSIIILDVVHTSTEPPF